MLTKYYSSIMKPYNVFDTLRHFNDVYSPSGTWESYRTSSSAYRTEQTDDGLELSVDLPGVKQADLSVTVSGRTVQISGKLRGTEFNHTYSISKDYNPDPISATLSDGVLVLKFSKAEESKTKVVQINFK